MEDLVIIGSGPAGISAALYAVRGNVNPLVLTSGAGALEKAEKIENYYGNKDFLTGQELHENGMEQARRLGVRFQKTQVLGVHEEETFVVDTNEGGIPARAVILATGARRRAPKIRGLKELEGRGVSYCAVCDAFFYRGKDVAVLGSGDFALHEADELTHLAGSVTIMTNGEPLAFTRECPYPVEERKIVALEGSERIEQVRFDDQNTSSIDGVFVAIGTAGSSEIARQLGVQITDRGEIVVDDKMQTNIPGIFAAGDCTGGLLQISKAVYEGTVAGIQAGYYIRQSRNSSGAESV